MVRRKRRNSSGEFLFFILFFFLSALFLGQGNLSADDNKLREDILTEFKAKGEEGLRNYVKSKSDSLTQKFIAEFAEAGVKGKKEEWLKICTIIAEEKKDEKISADVQGYVLLAKGDVLFDGGDNTKSMELYEKALPLFEKAGDPVGQGSVYKRKGDVYFNTGEHDKAGEMYDKAMALYEKAGRKVDF